MTATSPPPPHHHPCLSLYRGDSRLEVALAPTLEGAEDGAAAAPTSRRMGIIQLHHTLFPPAPVGALGEVANENYAVQLASPLGLEMLRSNWRSLLCALFPCLLEEDDPLPEVEPHAAADADVDAAADAADAPLVSPERCVLARCSTHDYDRLREPGTMDRLFFSFVVFLRFFGWRVHDEQRGVLDRHRNWESRYQLLEKAYHASLSSEGGQPRNAFFLLSLTEGVVGGASGGEEEEEATAQRVRRKTREALLAMPSALPQPDSFDYYSVALLRIVHCFLDFGFLTLAVGLVEFLLEEMACGRLGFLHGLVEGAALPCVRACKDIHEGHKQRLGRKLFKLTHSDSD